MVLQCTEELEVDITRLADSIRRVEVVHADAVIHGVLVEADRFLNFIAITDQMLLPAIRIKKCLFYVYRDISKRKQPQSV